MGFTRMGLAAVVVGLMLSGCGATKAQKPILYPNAKLEEVGQEQAQADIATCRKAADEAIKDEDVKTGQVAKNVAIGAGGGAAIGAVGGAVGGGGAGSGAAIGAATGAVAGLLQGLLTPPPPPSPAYKAHVNKCLTDKGYDVISWD
ncbi:MAG: hypothetical protein U1F33_06010 [Alphaproteobacteria bacterium]